MQAKEMHEHWSSRFAFILAAIGAAVGLGNFWRFPYTAGENGGGAFVLVYIICVILIGLPVLMAELMVGRRAGLSAVASVAQVAREEGHSGGWAILAWMGMIASFLILTFYSVIAGWIIAYIPDMATGAFHNVSAEESGGRFDTLLANPVEMIIYHGLFMALTIAIVARGLKKGIEVAVEILMPLFFIMLLAVVGLSLTIGDVDAAFEFLFTPDFSKITPPVILDAIGQAFFSIGLGAALMITYGAYLTSKTKIPNASVTISFADTMVAILAGIAIFPIVFKFGLAPDSGPGLIFVTLPVAFGQMEYGQIFGTVFFALALFAALTSSISLLEIMVSWGEEHGGWGRPGAAIVGGLVCWAIGIANVFSFNVLKDFHPLGFIDTFAGKTIFDLIDYLTSNIMLPLGGLLVAVFAGWVVSRELSRSELAMPDGLAYRAWRFLMRFVAPISVGAVLLYLTIGQAFLN